MARAYRQRRYVAGEHLVGDRGAAVGVGHCPASGGSQGDVRLRGVREARGHRAAEDLAAVVQGQTQRHRCRLSFLEVVVRCRVHRDHIAGDGVTDCRSGAFGHDCAGQPMGNHAAGRTRRAEIPIGVAVTTPHPHVAARIGGNTVVLTRGNRHDVGVCQRRNELRCRLFGGARHSEPGDARLAELVGAPGVDAPNRALESQHQAVALTRGQLEDFFSRFDGSPRCLHGQRARNGVTPSQLSVGVVAPRPHLVGTPRTQDRRKNVTDRAPVSSLAEEAHRSAPECGEVAQLRQRPVGIDGGPDCSAARRRRGRQCSTAHRQGPVLGVGRARDHFATPHVRVSVRRGRGPSRIGQHVDRQDDSKNHSGHDDTDTASATAACVFDWHPRFRHPHPPLKTPQGAYYQIKPRFGLIAGWWKAASRDHGHLSGGPDPAVSTTIK